MSTKLRLLSDYLNPYSMPEYFHKLNTVRVILVDYESIYADFPQTKKLSKQQINEWLIQNCSYVSMPQTKNSNLTTEINFDATSRCVGFRPPLYGRSAIFPINNTFKSVSYILNKNIATMSLRSSAKFNFKTLFLRQLESQINFVKSDDSGTSYELVKNICGFDIKGCGARKIPSRKSHSNGVIFLADCIREYIIEKIIRKILGQPEFKKKIFDG